MSGNEADRLRGELFGETYTVPVVAQALGVNEATVQRYIRTGMLEGFKIGREYRITERSLSVYAEVAREQAQDRVRRAAEERRSAAAVRRTERTDGGRMWLRYQCLNCGASMLYTLRGEEERWEGKCPACHRMLEFAPSHAEMLDYYAYAAEPVIEDDDVTSQGLFDDED